MTIVAARCGGEREREGGGGEEDKKLDLGTITTEGDQNPNDEDDLREMVAVMDTAARDDDGDNLWQSEAI